uniref:QWRF motif-containing protein 3 n=1 Tax=Erigeron canadensis TaxID=72917 RepID=UPI001CB9C960|nr:QWRF motif-containing protein 3 [Erigeron canadensis]
MISDQARRLKSREVSSRYLSSTVSSPPVVPNHNNNPKLSTLSTKQKHKHTGFIRGLWSSSASHSTRSHNENQPTTNKTTLADHLGNEKQKDSPKRSEKVSFPSKQNSFSEFRRSENNMNNKSSSSNLKEQYHSPSMRYSELRSSISSVSTSSSSVKSLDILDSNQGILPGRLSVDENALRRRSSYYQMRSDYENNLEGSHDHLGSPFTTGRNSPAYSYMAPTLSSVNSGIDVQSKYMNSSMPVHSSFKKSASMKRASSPLSEWVSSPARFGFGSPLYSGSKPPSSASSRGKKSLLHMGLDLIKGKKGGSKLRSSTGSDMGIDTIENVHRLRLLQNSWMQWRYANARAQDVNEHLTAQCELDLLFARESVAKLQQSVVQKRLQLQKEKLEMKLNVIIDSQINPLESWGDIERRHMVDISVLKDYLNAVVCMVPLIEGAKVDLESATVAFQHTSHLVATTKSMLSTFSPMAHDMLSELADVATQEKLLLEECLEHLRVISMLEIQERTLRCSIITMDSFYDQQQQLNSQA